MLRTSPRPEPVSPRRRSISPGAYVNYCSWASHRLPEVFPEPEAFLPEGFFYARLRCAMLSEEGPPGRTRRGSARPL